MTMTAVVTFYGNCASISKKKYYFLTNIQGLQKGDKLVVHTIQGLVVASFIEYVTQDKLEDIGMKPEKWVIQKINLTEHNKRMEEEEKRKEKKARLLALQKELENKRKSVETMLIYEVLAEKDGVFAETLNEYKQLLKEVQ